jgi:hypothetical protein
MPPITATDGSLKVAATGVNKIVAGRLTFWKYG